MLVQRVNVEEILKIRQRLNEIMADHSGRSVEDIARDTERDRFMSAEESKQYGLVDDVLASRISG